MFMPLFSLLSLKFPSLLEEKNTRPEVQSLCVQRHTMAEISTCTKTHYKDYSILALISLCLKSNYVFWC